MRLTVRDISRFFNVPDKTVLRWVEKDALPAARLGNQYRFNRAEVLEWATEKGYDVSPEILRDDDEEGAVLPLLSDALREGGVHAGLKGKDKAEVLRSVTRAIPLPAGVKPDLLFGLLMAREDLGSTALGEGVAVPHVRNPIVLHIRKPALSLCHLETPVEYGAIDCKPVHALFLIISPTVKGHLHLLSRLSFALRDSGFKAALARKAPLEAMLEEARRVEEGLAR